MNTKIVVLSLAIMALSGTEASAQSTSASYNFPIASNSSPSSGLSGGAYAPIGGAGSQSTFNADAYARREATRIRDFERFENQSRFMPRERRTSYFKNDSGIPSYLPLK